MYRTLKEVQFRNIINKGRLPNQMLKSRPLTTREREIRRLSHQRALRQKVRPYPKTEMWLHQMMYLPKICKELWDSWEKPLERLARQNAVKLISNCMTLLYSPRYSSPSMIYPLNPNGKQNKLKMFLDQPSTTEIAGLKVKDRLGPRDNSNRKEKHQFQGNHRKGEHKARPNRYQSQRNMHRPHPNRIKAGPPEVIQKPRTFHQLHQFPSSGSPERSLNEDPSSYYFE